MIRIAHPTRALAADKGPLLDVSHLRVSYGAVRAVKDLSLKVAAKEVVAIVGANGAGKSSTLRALLGLMPTAGGTIRLAGEDVGTLSTEARVARGMSLVPEGRAILAELSVRENLRLGAYSHKNAATIAETEADVVALFPRIGERMAQRAGSLSGGEQQMLAMGRALMARPALLLLDEPSLGLAPMNVRAIMDALAAVAESGVGVLWVEQNTRLALATSHRAYVLRGGEVVLEGDAWTVAQNAEVQAAYLGG